MRCVLAAAMVMVSARTALAQEQPPSVFQPKMVTWSWDKTHLNLAFTYREILDDSIRQKLSSGIPTLIVLTASLFEKGSKTPLSGVLVLKSCRVVYDVWDEVYAVEVTRYNGSAYSPAVPNLEGVYKRCFQLDRTPLIEREKLKPGESYEVKGVVEINPISQDVMNRIKRWVSRPKGASTVGAGDALFGSFVGLFIAQIGNADRVYNFVSSNPLTVPFSKK
ncbi:MAG: hypothetical protein RMJ98_11060 [Myxococcales bacterium]|nr:hypothetical protein [Myxococcales bacterium]